MRQSFQKHILSTYCVHNNRCFAYLNNSENNFIEHLWCTP